MILIYKGPEDRIKVAGQPVPTGSTFGERGSGADYEFGDDSLEYFAGRSDFEKQPEFEEALEDG